MMLKKSMTIALAALMATGAMAAQTKVAANTTTSKKKITKLKPTSRKVLTTKKEAIQDQLTTPQSSATTTSMPALTAGTSAAEAPKAMKKKTFVDNIRASVLMEYYGASIADPLSGQQTDRNEGFSEGAFPSELDTRVTLGYAVSPNLTVSYNAYFWSYADSAPGANDGETFGFRPADSFIRFNFGKFYQAGNFKWNGDLRFYPGLGKNGARLPLYSRTGQNFSYALTPRLSLAAYTTFRYYHRTDTAYIAENDPAGTKIDFRATVGPAIEFQALDTVGLSLSYNMDYAHAKNRGVWTQTYQLKNQPVAQLYYDYIELGSSIDINKSINLNPYIDMFPKSFNVEAMQFGANLNLSIL